MAQFVAGLAVGGVVGFLVYALLTAKKLKRVFSSLRSLLQIAEVTTKYTKLATEHTQKAIAEGRAVLEEWGLRE